MRRLHLHPLAPGAAGLVLLALLLAAPAARAQSVLSPSRVQFGPQWVQAIASTDGVTRAAGPGVTAQYTLRLLDHVGVSLRLGMDRLGVEQADPIERWDWTYWNAYYRNHLELLQRDPAYEVSYETFQEAVLLSAAFTPSVSFGGRRLAVELRAGPALVGYSRSLYLHEQWTKHFPEIEYDFSYELRNYAPDKTGLAWAVDAGVTAAWRLGRLVSITGGATYRHVLDDRGGALPFERLMGVDLGVALSY